jgi:hypothetical protein
MQTSTGGDTATDTANTVGEVRCPVQQVPSNYFPGQQRNNHYVTGGGLYPPIHFSPQMPPYNYNYIPDLPLPGFPMTTIGWPVFPMADLPALSHKLETGFTSMYIRPILNTEIMEKYPFYESRIAELNELCRKHKHVFQSWLCVLGALGILASIVLFIVRNCKADPNGPEQTCTGSESNEKCTRVTCDTPMYVPFTILITCCLIIVAVSLYGKAKVAKLVSEIPNKIIHFNQSDSSHGAHWILRTQTQVSHSDDDNGNTTMTTHYYIDLKFFPK